MSEEIAYVPVELPSQGVWYGGAIPKGIVQVRKSTTGEDLLLDSENLPLSERVNRLIKICTKFPEGFVSDNLLISDRVALAMGIRNYTYGPVYNFRFGCGNPRCGHENTTSVDFAHDLKIRTPEQILAENPDLPLDEPFQLTLPACGKSVAFRHLRGTDDEEIVRRAKSDAWMQTIKTRLPGVDVAELMQVSHRLVKIDGDYVSKQTSRRDEFYLGLEGRDTLAIRRFLKKFETGVSMIITRKCKGCTQEQNVQVPISTQTFRSDSDFE